jgi:putative flippase GtrA
VIGGTAATFNLALFLVLARIDVPLNVATPLAFMAAAALNYYLCILILFRHRARWRSHVEVAIFVGLVLAIAVVDFKLTVFFLDRGMALWLAKSLATALGLMLNFAARRFVVFPEPANPDWVPQSKGRPLS